MRRLMSVTLAVAFLGAGVGQAVAQVSIQGDLAVYTNPNPNVAPQIDYANAQPMALPQAQSTDDMRLSLLADAPSGTPGFSPGFAGSGATTKSVYLGKPTVGSAEFGNAPGGFSEHPFSTATADIRGAVGSPSSSARFATNAMWPYRASGKLFFQVGQSNFVCSASLIKRGIVVTAAHCVADFGQSDFYANWQFVPGYRNGSAPYGVWTAASVNILAGYYNGGTACSPISPGVVCPHDIAVMELNAQGGAYPGSATGWYGYGWDGYGFTSANLVHITQTGYPVCLENGLFMQRNDSHGFTGSTVDYQSNTIIGSLMCGGSSGGPWLTTFGLRPTLTGQVAGNEANSNIVVAVTSWGHTSNTFKQQGASRFRASNIVVLINAVCGNPVTDPRCL